jgi:hypothetical protein
MVRIRSPPAASQFKPDFPPLFFPITGSDPVELGLISGHRSIRTLMAGGGGRKRKV